MSYTGLIEADVDLNTPESKAVLSGAASVETKQPAGQSNENDAAAAAAAAGQLVPRQRLNQVIAQRNEAQSQIAELQKQIEAFSANQTPTANYVNALDVDAALEELNTLTDARDAALLEGDLDSVKQLSRQINGKNLEIMQLQSARTVVGENYVTGENALFTQTANVLQEQYPILNPNNEGYNQPLVDTIRALSAAKLSDNPNMTEAQSLYEATTQTMMLFGQVAANGSVNKSPVNQNVARKVAAAASQPAFLGGFGVGDNAGTEPDIDGIDVSKLTTEGWERLTPAQQNRLLGITS